MELRQFIAEAIKDVTLGIKDAKGELEKEVGSKSIAPKTPTASYNAMSYYSPEKIDFDVSVTVSDTTENKRGGGVKINIVRLDIDKDKISSTAATSRIKFSVPFFPQHIESNRRDEQ